MVAKEQHTYEDAMEKDRMNVWVADTGATCHMGCVKIGITDQRPSDTNIKVGNGERLTGSTKGDINVIYVEDLSIPKPLYSSILWGIKKQVVKQ